MTKIKEFMSRTLTVKQVLIVFGIVGAINAIADYISDYICYCLTAKRYKRIEERMKAASEVKE